MGSRSTSASARAEREGNTYYPRVPPGQARYVVEVNEGAVDITGQGTTWWLTFRHRYDRIGRIQDTTGPCIVGGKAEVACEDQEHAEWLAAHMVEHGGLPRTAVRVKVAAEGGDAGA